ncbi:MAG TPA: cyanophycin synthetase, partial [Terracidiphilus sp.]|nr:cyanophycin synthetase [Terracidiphilus sp.]
QRLVASDALTQLPSFFETLTAMAFLHFAESGVEIAVLEVGMGGRLDATNVVHPLLSIVTDISLDHTEWLGSTIKAIAHEKAGILRRNGTLITLPQHPEANQVLGEVAAELDVRGVSAVPCMPPVSTAAGEPYPIQALGETISVDSPLAGAHQHRNVALAIAAAVELATRHAFPITPSSLAAGIRGTRWPGRLERIRSGGCEWILDVAHNPAGAWALRAGLRDALATTGPHTLIFSCLRDKPAEEMAQILFPMFDEVILAPIHSVRATPMGDLLAAARTTGIPAAAAESTGAALEQALSRGAGGVTVIAGSAYLVGDARSLLLDESRQPVSAQP